MLAAMATRGSQVQADNRPHVLLVDTHQDCLVVLEKLFHERNFRVTRYQDSEICLAMIREKKQVFDLAVIEARMPGIDGLELIKLLRKDIIIPIILTSRDYELNVIRKGMEYGACYFFQKPISEEQVRAIDLDVLRAYAANKVVLNGDNKEDSNSFPNPATKMADSGSLSRNSRNPSVDSGSEDSKLYAVKREGDPINCLSRPPNKKPRVVWSEALHNKFVEAVAKFGITKAVPKKILEVMNVPYLTRENVASHLQKYRQFHKKQEEALQQPNSAAVAQTHNAPDPKPMATLPRLYEETNVGIYQNAISSFGYGAEETALPITQTQTVYNNSVMLPENGMGPETGSIMDWRQQIPPVEEPNILTHNQPPMPGGDSFQPPFNYAEYFVPNYGNSLGGYQGGADPLSLTQYDNIWLGYNDLVWQDPVVNLQPTVQQPPPPVSVPPPSSVYDYVPPNVFNQGGYDPTLHGNQFHQQPNQATAGDQFYFSDFPQDEPKFC